ncbi:MAG: ABC transporter substrate-binding protein [Chitinivibrionales bacterium]|nr:ABC transporter substrate-binding protein [Chitinivibrionales bacterium]
MHPLFKENDTSSRIVSLVTILVTACALFMAGCSSGDQDVTRFPRNQTLYVGGFQWGPPTTFNPLDGIPAWPMTGNMNLVYETLFGYNQLTGQLEGIIGKEYRLEDTSLYVTLNENAAWQDGTPLTVDDVIYTFQIHKNYNTHLHSHWKYLDGIRKTGDNEIEFILSKENYNRFIVLDIISVTPIIPKKVFEPLETKGTEDMSSDQILTKIRKFRNDSLPLGSGPYTLYAYSDRKIVLKRVDSYWGNVLYEARQAAPTYIIHLSFTDNDKFNLALQQGDLDISQTFCPQIWNKFNKGVKTWYPEQPYYVPAIIPCLLMGMTKAPFDDVAFRRACAHAIDYEKIKIVAMYGYSPDLQPGFILPFGAEKPYYSTEDAEKYGAAFNTQKAREILKEAGYSWGEDSLLIDPSGNKIRTLNATCPSGWTDWETTVKIAVTGLRDIGVDVRERFLEYPIWDKNLKNGLFDFTMRTPHPELSPSCPWIRFEKVMSSRHWAPVGQVMYENEGRYKNAAADSLLLALPELSDDAAIKEAYHELNRLFMQEMPAIPLMYRPWHFYQFSTKHWENFPTSDDPYAPPQCLMVGAGVKALWQLDPQK